MADTLESLEIEVKHSASGADTEIAKVVAQIRDMTKALQSVLPKLKEYASALSKVGGKIEESVGGKSGGKSGKDKSPLGDDVRDTIRNAGRLEVALHKVEKAESDMEDAFNSGNANKAWRAREAGLNAGAQVDKYSNVTAEPVPVDVQETIKAADAIDTLREKVRKLNEELQSAFASGDKDKAWGIRAQIIKAENDLAKAESKLEPQQTQPTPVDKQEIIESADAIDVLRNKILLLREAMQEAFAKGDTAGAWGIRGQIIQAEASLAKAEAALHPAQAEVEETTSAFQTMIDVVGKAGHSVASSVKNIASSISGRLHAAVSRIKKPIDNFVSSLKRIAFYRFIRSIIKEISKAFSEGLEWAYLFSTGITSEGHRFAQALDNIKSASTQMKAQLGSAFIGLLAAIEPIINQIIAAITRLADTLAQVFAAITGGTYLKATETAQKWAQATKSGSKAAKEWKNQLMGFDVINRLNEPNNGGGGGGKTEIDPKSLFKDSPISQSIKDFVDEIKGLIENGDWEGVGRLLGKKLNGVLEKISLNAENFGHKFIAFFTHGLDMLLGFIDEVDWSYVGQTIVGFLMGAVDEASAWITSKDWVAVGESIYHAFEELVGDIDWNEVATKVFTFLGEALGAVVGLIWGFIKKPVEKIRDYFSEHIQKYFGTTGGQNPGAEIAAGILDGIVEGLKNIGIWIYEHIFKPFIDGFKNAFGISSPSTVMKEQGEFIVEGLKEGVDQKWQDFRSFFEGLWEGLKSWWQGLSLGEFHIPRPRFEWTYEQASGLIAEALQFVGLPATIPHLNISWYAQGGFPKEDGLFMANHGELVGKFSNGRTAVANNDQIIAGIEAGVYRAMSSVMSGQNNEREIRVYLDGKEIGAASRRYERNISRATGVAMA